jgi:Sec-independent protein secretion pathway component TatC
MFNTLFYINLDAYMGTAWLITLGLGLVFETSIKELKMIKKVGLTPEMLGKITMEIVGGIAIIAGIISLPQINLQNPSFLAIKGIISILGIIFIIINTWVTESD